MSRFKRPKIRLYGLAIIAVATAAASAAMFIIPTTPSPQEAQEILQANASEIPKVLITEFADFNCKFCAEFALAYYPRLRQEYLTNPNVEFHFRHYPFLDDSSWDAAHAYECAKDQGLGEAFHDIAFQQHLKPEGPDFSPQGLTQIATVAGADDRIFDNCRWQNTGWLGTSEL